MTATGFPIKGDWPGSLDPQSIAFFSTAGMPWLYSGVGRDCCSAAKADPAYVQILLRVRALP